jgi:O-antigen ligase
MYTTSIPFPEACDKKVNAFQRKCEHFAKQCAVLFAFMIPLSTFGTNVALLTLIIAWLLAGSIFTKIKIMSTHPVALMAVGLFLIFVIGTLRSAAPLKESMGMLGIGKMGKLLYLPFLLSLMTEEKWRRFAIWAFVSALLLTLALSFLKIYGHLPIPSSYSSSAVFKDDIFTNLMMAFTSFVIGHYILAHPNFYTRLLLLSLLGVITFYVFFMSQGRSGYVVFLALWLLLCLQRLHLKGVLLGSMALMVLIGIAFFYSAPFQNRVSLALENIQLYQAEPANGAATSVGARLEYVKQTWHLSKQHFWLGFGTGSFKTVYENHAKIQDLTVTRNPHNEYLNILFQVGVVGLLMFLGLFVVILKNSYLLPKPEKWFAQGILVAMSVGCFANSWLMDFTSGYFFIGLTAFCFGALNLSKTRGIRLTHSVLLNERTVR